MINNPIIDRTDSSGMFSKAGRISTEMYGVLAQAQEILENKRHTKVTRHSDSQSQAQFDFKGKKYPNDQVKSTNKFDLNYHEEEPKKKQVVKTVNKLEPFKLHMSRDDHQKILLRYKSLNSSQSSYKPKFTALDKKQVFDVPFKRSVSRDTSPNLRNRPVPVPDNSDLRPHTSLENGTNPLCFLALEKQLPRVDMITMAIKQRKSNEDRFVEDHPKILTTYKRSPSCDFGRMTARSTPKSSNTEFPSYDPKFTLTHRRESYYEANWTRSSPRKPLAKKLYSYSDTHYNYDDFVKTNRSNMFPRTSSPSFDRMLPRDNDPEAVLPVSLLRISVQTKTGSRSASVSKRPSIDIRTPFGGGSNFSVTARMPDNNRALL